MNARIASIVGTAILGAGIAGGVAAAANSAPPTDSAPLAAPVSPAGPADKGKDHGADRIKKILEGLVDKGVITQAQADAIVDALAHARSDGKADLRQFVGDVLKESASYLGLSADQLKQQLASGKSLGEIANATPGKSRDGLVRDLDDAAAARIKAAVEAGKIKPDQAEQLRTKVDEAIVKLVDHERKAPSPTASPAQ